VNLHFVGAGVTFLWSTAFNDIVAFQYGVGLGFGGVIGDLIRTEAYPQNDGSGWEICEGALNPMSQSRYCAEINEAERHRGSIAAGDPDRTNLDGADGEHYDIKARRWSGGGSVPNVWFRAALPHLAIRIKPIRQLMMRVDFGFDLFSGFFVGFAANFGF
jgi:hypothetical protein